MGFRCDRCGRTWEDAAAAENELTCTRKCGGTLVSATEQGESLGESERSEAGDLSALPSILALPLHEYSVEPNPVLRLWHACDAVELALRFAVTAGLADLARRGPLPAVLLKELRPRIEEPTLGKWRGMAQAMVAALPEQDTALPELRPLVEDVLVPLLDGAAPYRTPETSLSALRNQLAHGGGVTRAVANRLLDAWHGRFAALPGQLAWLVDLTLAVRTAPGALGALRGPKSTPEPWQPPEAVAGAVTAAFARGDEVLLVRGGSVLTLWPLTLFGVPRSADPEAALATELVPQVYVRRGEVQLHLTPLGSDECASSEADQSTHDAFRTLFRLDEAVVEARTKGFEVTGFEADIRKDAAKLIGRAGDLETVRAALAAHGGGGILWLTGKAGIGKSVLVARIATELLDDPPQGTTVLPYRFKAGDNRCSRESFLRFALERLKAVLPEEEEKGKAKDEKGATSARVLLDGLKKRLGTLGEHKLLFILDGLDEIAERDALFAAEVPLALALPGITWLCAGRPEGDLQTAFSGKCVTPVFPNPDGVPKMDEGDVRTMLLERIGSRRKRLLANDKEQGNRVTNAFVTKVTACAEGLPLYVNYVIGDINDNRYLSLTAGERLPLKLEHYYEELLRRCRVGITQVAATKSVATLAVAAEPLSAEALAEILVRGNDLPDSEQALSLVRRGLAAVASMIRRSATPEGGEGYTVYHHSLRQHMEASAEMAPALATARRHLANLAADPGVGPVAPYLYRHGTAHLLETHRRDEALAILTNFAYLMARLRLLGDPEGPTGLLTDWRTAALGALSAEQRLWEAFFRERAHILRRGGERWPSWPSYKILLQLALEHADDSPVTRQAEAWLARGHCNWLWLRRALRPRSANQTGCVAAREGAGMTFALSDGRLLSASEKGMVTCWDPQVGTDRWRTRIDEVFEAKDCFELPDGTLVVSDLGGFSLLSGATGNIEKRVDLPFGKNFQYPLILSSGNVLCTTHDDVQCWDAAKGDRLWSHRSSNGEFLRTIPVDGGSVLACERGGRITCLDAMTGAIRWVRDGLGEFSMLRPLDAASALLADRDSGVIRILSLQDGGDAISISVGENRRPFQRPSAQLIGDRFVVMCGVCGPLAVWDLVSGSLWRPEVTEEAGPVAGAITVSECQALSWGHDGTLRLWDVEAKSCVHSWQAHESPVDGVQVIAASTVLSWSSHGPDARLWDFRSGRCIGALVGHTAAIEGVRVLDKDHVVTWARDGTARVWDLSAVGTGGDRAGHTDTVNGMLDVPNVGIATWSDDGTVRFWNHKSGAEVGALTAGREDRSPGIREVTLSSSGLLVVEGFFGGVQVWDPATLTLMVDRPDCRDAVLLESDEIASRMEWHDAEDNRVRVSGVQVWSARTGSARLSLAGECDRSLVVTPEWLAIPMAFERSGTTSQGFSYTETYYRTRLVSVVTGEEIARLTCEGRPDFFDRNRAFIKPGTEGDSWWVEPIGGFAQLIPHPNATVIVPLEGRAVTCAPNGHDNFNDGRAYLWDLSPSAASQVPKLPLRVFGHLSRCIGATVTPGGRLVTWDIEDWLKEWDMETGESLRGGPQELLEVYDPYLVVVRWTAESQSGVTGEPRFSLKSRSEPGWAALSRGKTLTLIHESAGVMARWQGEGKVTGRAMLEDGSVVATTEDHQVLFLRLMGGAKPLTVPEAAYVAEYVAASRVTNQAQ